MSKKHTVLKIIIISVSVIAVCALLLPVLEYYGIVKKKHYSSEDFSIETVRSSVDFNSNGIDDYTDIMLGARLDAKNKPAYDGSYQAGGYPPDDIGVCTDVVWRAFKNAGYCLRDMVDRDISLRPEAYRRVTAPDSNIDFRRVPNLHVFFAKYALSLTTDPYDTAEWQAGDIVIFANDKHIGIISDRRNKKGVAYLIHNGGQPKREEDALLNYEIIAHYRFDASNIPPDTLIAWE